MRYTYIPLDGPLQGQQYALTDDQFDDYSNQIMFTIEGGHACYRRHSKGSGYTTEYKTVEGGWSYKSDARRALTFIGNVYKA